MKYLHGYHTLISCPGATDFPHIGSINRCHVPFIHSSANLCVSSWAPSDELILYAQFLPTIFFRFDPLIPEWMTAPPLPWHMHCSAMGYAFFGSIAVTPVV